MLPIVDLQLQYIGNCELPNNDEFYLWVKTALENNLNYELSIVLVDETQSAELNLAYRGKNYPTNVLSFVFDDEFAQLEVPLLGDLIICVPIVAKEAFEQNKSFTAHLAHLVIHGTLHLLGFDHENELDAEIMERKECDLLAKLGFTNPYF